MKQFVLFILAGVLASILMGCATQMSKSEYAICISTGQPGQEFKVYNRKGEYVHQGRTPQIVVLKAQSEYFTHEIYTIKGPNNYKLEATMTPFYWGNVFMPFGFAIDGVTGAMWALPDKVDLNKPQDMNQVNW